MKNSSSLDLKQRGEAGRLGSDIASGGDLDADSPDGPPQMKNARIAPRGRRPGYHLAHRLFLPLLLFLSTSLVVLRADTEIDRYIESEMELNAIPGVSLVVVRDGQVTYVKAYGVSSVETGQAMTINTPVELASLSKSLTALAILQLEREGILDRDQQVSVHLPEFRGNKQSGLEDITIRQLLRQRSGLRREHDFRVACCGQDGEFDLDLAVNRIAEAKPASRPGEVFSYANANYILAAALVERLCRQSFPDCMDERIFRELGMNRTTIGRARAKSWGLADPHEWQWGRVRVSPSPFFGWYGASLVNSSAADMGRYLAFLMRPPATGPGSGILSSEWWKQLEKGYDLGWFVQAEAAWLGGELVLEHAGDVWGGNTAAVLAPRLGAGVAVLTNVGMNHANAMARAVLLHLRGLEVPVARRGSPYERPDTWAIGFVAATVLLLIVLLLYARRVRRKWRAGERRWSATGWRMARAVLLAGLGIGVLYALFGAAPPLRVFPTTVKLALPALALTVVVLFFFAALDGLLPSEESRTPIRRS